MPDAFEQSKALLVRRWGEMGGYWGINRTMAEIHALLFVSQEALCTDDIMEQLKVSRGSASTNLRGLVDWGLIQRLHKLGDRKEYFQADADIWHMFETITRERRRREVEPIVATIEHCREIVSNPEARLDRVDPKAVEAYLQHLDELRAFLSTMGTLFDIVLRYGSGGIGKLTRLLAAAVAGRSGARRGGTSGRRGDTARRSKAAKRGRGGSTHDRPAAR